MESTLEVRWFQEGAVPEAVAAWFARLEPGTPAVREDVYLAPPDPDLSVKLRRRRIQVKRRLGDGSGVRFAPHAAGHMERWEKFSFRLDGARWWTICFEAVGAPEALPCELRSAGTHLFSTGDAPALKASHSQGYAHWLRRIAPVPEPHEARCRTEPFFQAL